ncbi:hypothetical protein L6164_007561 [Bauhinia variegata]|uniref:Uncharacterized protein n=1 Tax=Bauhinia variegata TaxID=167791 RepID=A0ACB9PEC1_BAUVA|nr:hypothetical protein L6164_007561 [Bauhinia variegata]
MSNGGGETGRQLEQPNTRRKLGGDDFAKAIAKIAVAQVCESEGFQSVQQSALETLCDVVVQYIWSIGKIAHDHANLAGRAECNVFDTIQGLEDLASSQGFSGASDIDHCLGSSGIVQDIVHFVSKFEQIPFAFSIPQFPVVKKRVLTPSFSQMGEDPPGEHITAWLPAFPDPQTYAQDERGMEPRAAKFELEREDGIGERCALNFQQQLVSSMFGKSTFIDLADAKAKAVAAEGNPFLAAPLQLGDKEVSSVVAPVKLSNDAASENPVVENFVEDKSISVREMFAPAIEAMKNTLCGSEEEQRNLLLNGRPTVQFKIGMGRKFLGSLVDPNQGKEEHKKTLPFFEMEDEKDDKKRRAEKILRESLENPDELVQM